MKKSIFMFLTAVMTFLPAGVLAHAGEDDFSHHMDGFNMMGFGGGFNMIGFGGWVTMILLWLFLLLGAFAFWTYIDKNRKN